MKEEELKREIERITKKIELNVTSGNSFLVSSKDFESYNNVLDLNCKNSELKGFLAGQNSQKEKCLKIIEEHIGCTDGDCLEIIKQKIKGGK